MDKYTLHHGDCLEYMRSMADNSVDCVITDPPYYKVKGEWWDRQWDTPAGFIDWIGKLAEQWQRILKPNGSLYVFASPKMAARVEVKLTEWFSVLNTITWKKPPYSTKAEMFDKPSMRCYFTASERIIFAEHYGADNIAKGEAGYLAQCDKLRGFIFDPLRKYLADEWNRAGLKYDEANIACETASMAGRHYFAQSQWCLPTEENYYKLREYANTHNHGGKYLCREYKDLRREYEELRRPFSVSADVPYTDVWDFDTVSFYPGKHPCEKPQDMLEHMIKASTKPDAIIFDCFAGSGSTGLAALKLGRRFIGCEIDAEYFKIAERRIREAYAQPLLFDAPAVKQTATTEAML